jgi:glycerol-3-phosphate acyltransferase PlsY
MALFVVTALVVGYFLGALPFGYWVARARGVNIFEVGSKSPGATNVRRVLGAGPGNVVFAFDALKGAIATAWPLWWTLVQGDSTRGDLAMVQIAGLVAAMLGHSFSCFTRFRGGKGVATAAGGILMLLPMAALIVTAVWMVTFYASRFVSLASITAAIALPLAAWFLGRPLTLVAFSGLVAALVIMRHRSNIVRLLNGTENRFVKKNRSPSAS